MAATTAMVAQLRRMVNEPSSSSTYSDIELKAAIEACPVPDDDGNDPTEIDWTAGYDLHRTAAAIWQEKAATAAQDYNFSADGGNFSRSNVYEQYMKQCRYHEARRQPGTIKLLVSPKPTVIEWVSNLAEVD